MISFITPSDEFAMPQPGNYANKLIQQQVEFTEAKIREALIAKFGELPPLEVIAKQMHCFVTPDGVHHYVWFEPGESREFDPTTTLVSIAPPKYKP